MPAIHRSVAHPKEIVLITGAAGGLGRAFVVECARRGWDLFLTDLHADSLQTLAFSLRSTYRIQVKFHACDLTDPASRIDLLTHLKEQHLFFNALINVAGVDFEGPFYDQSLEQIQTITRLNIEGTLAMIRGIQDLQEANHSFRILNVASLAAFSPMPVKATYAASKRFLVDFSLALREELRDKGITVTVLCPAGMPTTAENVQAIQAQGWLGQITTQNVGMVAVLAIDAMLAGKAICIPGMINKALHGISALAPSRLAAWIIGQRWKNARRKRAFPFPAIVSTPD